MLCLCQWKKKINLALKKKSCIGILRQFWWVSSWVKSRNRGDISDETDLLLCSGHVIKTDKMWMRNTTGFLLFVQQEKKGRAGKQCWSGMKTSLPGSPASTSLCWTDWALLAGREAMAPEVQNRDRTWTLRCVSSSDLNDKAGSSDSAWNEMIL